MIRIAIVDDEKEEVMKIKAIVEEFFQSIAIEYQIHEFYSGEELLNHAESLDLIILDIQMNGIDGIETAMKIRSKDKKVKLFYITNYAEEMSRVFSVYAFAFIEKPVNKNELYQNLHRFLDYHNEDVSAQKKMIRLKSVQGDITVCVQDIIYLEYIGNRKINIFISNDKKVIYGSMKEIFQTLSPYDFIQTHESFIVNEAHIHSVRPYEIIMDNNTEIPIAQKKLKKITMQISNYLHNQLKEDK